MNSVASVFSLMDAGVRAGGPELVKKVNGVVLYEIGGKPWTVDLKNGDGSVKEGKHATPDVTIIVADDDFLQLANGKLNPQQAFMRGKLKLKGNMALAMKLNTVLDAARKSLPAAATAAGAGGNAQQPAAAGAGSSAAAPAHAQGLKSQEYFDAIELAIHQKGAELVKSVGGVITFNLTQSGATVASYTLDLKSGSGKVSKTAAPSADLTITISDADFAALGAGKMTAQTAFMRGLLKVKGNMGLAMKLQSVLAAAQAATKPTARL